MQINLNIDAKVFNPIYLKYMLHNDNRYQIYYGGSSSGKSYSLAQRTVLDVLQGRNYLIVRNTQVTIKRSCFNEVVKAISNFKVSKYFDVNKSDLVITCNINKAQILFAGLDDVEKIKSITPINGVITDIWAEEATETEYKDIKQLDKRLRGRSKFCKRLTLSFNPVSINHWIYKQYFSIWEDNKQYVEKNGLSILKTTYRDNRFLAPDDIQALENETDAYYKDVYTNGNWGVLGALIYRNWKVEDFAEIENQFDNLRYGVDFGFANDEAAFIKLHLDTKHKTIYVCDEIYATGLLNDELANLIKPIVGSKSVLCDSAEPKSIADLKRCRINAVAAKKGPDSIEHGIKWIQGYSIVIHPRCQNFRNEISTYQYKQDKDGNVLPIPVDKNNHLLDALRYALSTDMNQQKLRTMSKSALGL